MRSPTYARRARPSPSHEVIDFYSQCGFDYGLSVDHVILAFQPELDESLTGLDVVPEEWRERQKITFELAERVPLDAPGRGVPFTPVGIAQGWSPGSYATAVAGAPEDGLPLHRPGRDGPAEDARDPRRLKEVARFGGRRRSSPARRDPHRARPDEFRRLGVVSFDSTSPLRQAFKDDKDNYYTMDRTYCASPRAAGRREPQAATADRLGQRRPGEASEARGCVP